MGRSCSRSQQRRRHAADETNHAAPGCGSAHSRRSANHRSRTAHRASERCHLQLRPTCPTSAPSPQPRTNRRHPRPMPLETSPEPVATRPCHTSFKVSPLPGLIAADRGMYRRHAPPGPLRRNHFARNHSAPTPLASLALRSSLARPRTKKSRPYGLRRRSTPEVVTPEHPDHREPTKQGDTKMNNVTLVGRLATDPRLEATNGNPICTFRLAVDRGKQDGADFIPVKCFGAAAENHAKYLTKGRLISLTGGSATHNGPTKKPATRGNDTKSSAASSATSIPPRPRPTPKPTAR